MQGNTFIPKLYKMTYVYLALPLLVFFLTWLGYAYALIFSLLLISSLYLNKVRYITDNSSFCLTPKMNMVAVFMALAWCFFAGIGYFYYQSFDYHFRNALFHDLTAYAWPVMYQKAHTPLAYYMGFWLLPALISKSLFLFSMTKETVFFIGNICLYVYAAIGVWLIFLHIAVIITAKNCRQLLIAMLIFMFFSGLDIIGYCLFPFGTQPFSYHLDWWAAFIQYSSVTTSLFWVFNQFIPTALVMLLIYNERLVKNFGLLLTFILFLAPYPAIGIGIFMCSYAIAQFVLTAQKKDFIFNYIFSVTNIIGLFWLLPIVIFYLSSNSGGIDRFSFFTDFINFKQLFLFLLLEFLIYAAILCKYFKRDIFFITAIVSLCLFPLIRLDQQNNFCMRASMPALIMLSIFVICFLFQSYRQKKDKFLREALFCLFLIGSATPIMEFYRGLHYVFDAKQINLVKDEIKTLDQENVIMPVFGYRANHQFTAGKYKDDIFWKYLAKKH